MSRRWQPLALVTLVTACLPSAEPGRPPAAEPSAAAQSADAATPGPSDTAVAELAPPTAAAVDAAAPPPAPLPVPVDAAAVETGRPDLSGGISAAMVSGFELLVRARQRDGSAGPPVPFDIRGISWSPAARGAGRPDSAAYLAAADRDLPLMRAANINAIKSYVPLSRAVLDKLHAHGIVAIVTLLNTADENVEPAVAAIKDHPALLMWILGNEWNLNRLYGSCTLDECYARVNQVARRIKALDPNHPVATSFAPTGELPSDEDMARLDAIDVWGLNVYSQPGFFNRFANWRLSAQRTGRKKPFFLSEYGADAFDNRMQRTDEAGQAAALRRQTQEIRSQLSARNPAFACLGGTPFEWNDEWWKHGNPAAQDPGGFAHDGVAADRFANEEWWGVVDVDRRPRAAYEVLQELYSR